MFRVSHHPSSGVLKTVPAASGTGHTTCTATPLQRGLIGTAVICCIPKAMVGWERRMYNRRPRGKSLSALEHLRIEIQVPRN